MALKKTIVQRLLPSGEPAPFTQGEPADEQSLIAQLYALRGYNIKRSFEPSANTHYELASLLPPAAMKGLPEAAVKLADAVEKQQRILIVGDFDADGATSTALAMRVLRAFGLPSVQFLVPNRFEYGYGLTPEIVEVASGLSPDIIVTVDNGIASYEGVAAANHLGIDVIVTDHHLPPQELPKALAIVNPNQKGCEFASKNLAGVGVIFYVLCAVRRELIQRAWFEKNNLAVPNMANYLDLVALGTVADVVVLDFNNRVLVQQGLKRMRANACCAGIKALFHVAGKEMQTAGAQDLGFVAGPRLNAAGRLDDMSVGIELLLEDDFNQAIYKAGELDALNKERRQIESSMQVEANKLLEQVDSLVSSHGRPQGVCLYQADWHQGVIGIVASRVKDKIHRPTIVFAKSSDTEIKGSGRSVQGVHLRDVLDNVATSNPGMLTKFGGHAMAAGLTLELTQLKAFEKAFDAAVSAFLKGGELKPVISSDGPLPASLLALPAAQAIAQAGPWGQGFSEPIFSNRFKIISNKIVGANHCKFVLAPEDNPSRVIDAIAFNVDTDVWPGEPDDVITMAYALEVNTFRGKSAPQIRAIYLEPAL